MISLKSRNINCLLNNIIKLININLKFKNYLLPKNYLNIPKYEFTFNSFIINPTYIQFIY